MDVRLRLEADARPFQNLGNMAPRKRQKRKTVKRERKNVKQWARGGPRLPLVCVRVAGLERRPAYGVFDTVVGFAAPAFDDQAARVQTVQEDTAFGT